MSFFTTLLNKNNLSRHDGRSLWKYSMTESDLEKLNTELKYTNVKFLDPRDVTLFYSIWWKKYYDGGKPTKQTVFDSLGGNTRFELDCDDLYKLAIKGAQILGVKWIKKQNTLYFRTLLLQGGLPLAHIAENQGQYQNFLLAVLEEQPDTIEDFIFKPEIVNLLPQSSQNELIYENCLEIVKSILNDESEYDELLNSDDVIKSISNQLKIRKSTLERKQRLSKPKNYWLMNFQKDKTYISLKIGLADFYDNDSLSNILGFELKEREYQFYLNEDLICVFRKMANEKFKTDWYGQPTREWNQESILPYIYVIQDGVKIEVKDFIQAIPNFAEPSIWDRYSENEWRLIKGSGTSHQEAAVLFPTEWKTDLPAIEIKLYGRKLQWLVFEGEVEISNSNQHKRFMSGINSYSWIIESQKPSWITKSNMPVVKSKPKVLLYDENDTLISREKYNVWVRKHNSNQEWQDLTQLKFINSGCLDLKIDKDGLVAYDIFYNLDDFHISYNSKSIEYAELEVRNKNIFEFSLDETELINIEIENNLYKLHINTQFSKLPTSLKGNIGLKGQRKLFIEMQSPFEGIVLLDRDGTIIPENQQLAISNLYGIRILSSSKAETLITIKNSIKTDVKITKEIKETSQQLIAFKDEIVRLYYLADAMNYRNTVSIEIIEGKISKTYQIAGFSHTLNIEQQFERTVSLYDSMDFLDLYAVPLNCLSKDVEIIPLLRNDNDYEIPSTSISDQFIIISSKEKETQLMPRFVTTDENLVGSDKNLRIDQYHSELANGSFNDEIWKRILAYFHICVKHDLPFSTFDELRAISKSSIVTAKAFFYFGINQSLADEYIQKHISEMEKDLGICFHWIKKKDWETALDDINQFLGNEYFNQIFSLLTLYMKENELMNLLNFITESSKSKITVYNAEISDVRGKLGERVLRELPSHTPKISSDYGIAIDQHLQVKLLLRAPIAVAESINDTQQEFPIWAGDDFREVIRRNIQYSQYLNPEFYNRVMLHALKNN